MRRDDRLGREVLAALFAFGQGELAEEIFVDVAEDVLGVQVGVLERDGGDQVDQAGQVGRVDLELGVGLVQDVLEAGVLPLDGLKGVVDQLADGRHAVGGRLAVADRDLGPDRQLGAVLQRLPPGQGGDPEDVLLHVVVAVLQLGPDRGGVVVGRGIVGRVQVVVAGRVAELAVDLGLPVGEGVGDVLEEDEPPGRRACTRPRPGSTAADRRQPKVCGRGCGGTVALQCRA